MQSTIFHPKLEYTINKLTITINLVPQSLFGILHVPSRELRLRLAMSPIPCWRKAWPPHSEPIRQPTRIAELETRSYIKKIITTTVFKNKFAHFPNSSDNLRRISRLQLTRRPSSWKPDAQVRVWKWSFFGVPNPSENRRQKPSKERTSWAKIEAQSFCFLHQSQIGEGNNRW